MPISLTCECGRQLLAKDDYAGRRTKCPDCGRELLIPEIRPEPAGNPYQMAGGGGPLSSPYGEPGPAKSPYPMSPQTSGKAIASLILGLVSMLFCMNVLTGIPAIILGAIGLGEIGRSGGRFTGKGMAITGIITGILGSVLMPIIMLTALLLPAIQQAREAARRIQCTNNLKQVALAEHNFESAHGAFPAQAIVDANGQPLLSWRVAILPYLGEQALYDQFHLDEAWDSPHNLSLLTQMPTMYACPSDVESERIQGLTHYQVYAGPGTLFDPAVATFVQPGVTRGVPLSQVLDGTSNTLMVVESGTTVEWTKPDDIPYVPGAGVPLPRSKHPGGGNVAMADGSIRFFKTTISPQVFEGLVTRARGEVISADAY